MLDSALATTTPSSPSPTLDVSRPSRGPLPVALIMTQEDDSQPALRFNGGKKNQESYGKQTGYLHPGSHSPTHPHPQHSLYNNNSKHVIRVDTIITDSNGNTSRYDSSDRLSNRTSGGGQSIAGRESESRSSSASPTGQRSGGLDSQLSSDRGAKDRPARAAGNHHGNDSGNANIGVGMTVGAGSSRRSSPGKSTFGPGANIASPGIGGRRLSSASSDRSNNSLMSQEALFLNVPTVAFSSDPTPTSEPAHHARASSFREPKSIPRSQLVVEDAGLGQVRRNSMPNVCNNLLLVPGASANNNNTNDVSESKDTRVRRVRSFKTTSKGAIVNRGDSFKKKSTHSLMSTGSTVTDSDARARRNSNSNNSNAVVDYGQGSSSSPAAPAYFRVNMMGAAGVGKTSLAHQFLTSEYVDHDDADETQHMTVTVLLDGEESTIEFIDPPDRNVISENMEQLLDAYVVVFAINDHDSFDTAQQLVRYLRVDYGSDRAILLVANKIDLVRKRKVTAEEARLLATTFDCKYAETSAALNHYVDELLVGIITQIRLQLSVPFTTIFFPHKESKRRKNKKTLCKGPRGFFTKLFRRSGFGSHGNKKDRAVENLLY